MADAGTAETYARALFEKAIEKYVRDLHALDVAVTRSKQMARLDNPAESFDYKKAVVNGLLPAEAEVEIRNLAYLLATKNQMHLFSQVVGEFDKIVARGVPGTAAQVTTTIELTGEDKAKLESGLRKQYGQDLAFDYRIDPSILGGVVVRVGDVVIDGSVTGKLAALKQKMETAR